MSAFDSQAFDAGAFDAGTATPIVTKPPAPTRGGYGSQGRRR